PFGHPHAARRGLLRHRICRQRHQSPLRRGHGAVRPLARGSPDPRPDGMRLSFLSDAVYPFHHGGKETLHYERSIRLARRGHGVRIHTMHWWLQRKRSIVQDGIVFQSVAPRTALYTSKGSRSIWESLVMGIGSLRMLWSPP